MSDMKLAVMGAAGRMGRELVRAVHAMPGCVIAGGVEVAGSPAIGADAGELAGLGRLGAPITADRWSFSRVSMALSISQSPAASVEFAGLAANARIVHVIGTTGFSDADEAAIKAAARHATIVKAGNMSLGVNLLAATDTEDCRALDEEFDIEIVEMHHRHKVDAPSGTALMLGSAAAAGRGIALKDRSVRSRDGHTGARQPRHDRLCDAARRRCDRRSYCDLRRARRAHRGDA